MLRMAKAMSCMAICDTGPATVDQPRDVHVAVVLALENDVGEAKVAVCEDEIFVGGNGLEELGEEIRCPTSCAYLVEVILANVAGRDPVASDLELPSDACVERAIGNTCLVEERQSPSERGHDVRQERSPPWIRGQYPGPRAVSCLEVEAC